MQFFQREFEYPVHRYKHEMTGFKLEDMNGKYTETSQSNLQVLLIPRHVSYLHQIR